MTNKTFFVFFNENSSETTSQSLGNVGDIESFTLEVSGSGENLEVQGCSDIENDEWHTIGCISLKDYKIYTSVNEEGLYSVPMAGVQRCRIINNGTNGSFKAFAVAIG